MDDLLRGARDKVLRETVGSMDWDSIMQGFVCIGALVFLGLLVMAFLLALVVKRKTNDSSEEEGSISPDDAPAPSEVKIAPDDPGADTDPPVTATPSSSPAAADTEIVPGLVLCSGVLYFLACCFPVVGGLDEGAGVWGSGFAALTLGIFVLPVAWIANPLYLGALVLSAKGRHGAALPFSATATIIAFVTLLFIANSDKFTGPAPLMWASTMALLVVSNIRAAD